MFRIKSPPKILYKSKAEVDILQRLDEFVDSNLTAPMKVLARLWKDQQDALSYREIREAIQNGELDQETIEAWIQDYTMFVSQHFAPMWLVAISTGGTNQPLTRNMTGFAFTADTPPIQNWIANHTGSLITSITNEQVAAVKAMIGRTVDGKYTVDELSRVLRPCIGLNERQSVANLRYYETIRDNLLNQNPRMKVESAQKEARDMAMKYAERQHRQRAYMIAETELVTAYNQGNEQAVLQAQETGLLGAIRRVGLTADDERVCGKCTAKHRQELKIEDGIPPWHPRCRCAVMYVPIESEEGEAK